MERQEASKIVREELKKRSIRWNQQHRDDLDLISSIYEDLVFNIRDQELRELHDKLEKKQVELNTREKVIERQEQILTLNKESVEAEKKAFYELDEDQRKIYCFMKAIAGLLAKVGSAKVPDSIIKAVTDIVVGYMEAEK